MPSTPLGLGGYSFGVDGKNQRLSLKKLTEHNVDVYGFFTNHSGAAHR